MGKRPSLVDLPLIGRVSAFLRGGFIIEVALPVIGWGTLFNGGRPLRGLVSGSATGETFLGGRPLFLGVWTLGSDSTEFMSASLKPIMSLCLGGDSCSDASLDEGKGGDWGFRGAGTCFTGESAFLGRPRPLLGGVSDLEGSYSSAGFRWAVFRLFPAIGIDSGASAGSAKSSEVWDCEPIDSPKPNSPPSFFSSSLSLFPYELSSEDEELAEGIRAVTVAPPLEPLAAKRPRLD